MEENSCDWKARAASAQSLTLRQQATIGIAAVITLCVR